MCIKLAMIISCTRKLLYSVLLTREIVLFFFRTGDAPTFDNEWKQKTGAQRGGGRSVEDSRPATCWLLQMAESKMAFFASFSSSVQFMFNFICYQVSGLNLCRILTGSRLPVLAVTNGRE